MTGIIAWLLIVGFGCFNNSMDVEPIPRKVNHPLSGFDKVLRTAGPLIPFAVVVPRMAVPHTACGGERIAWQGVASTLLLYLGLTVFRIALYLIANSVAPKIMADHLVLGSSIYGILFSEAVTLAKYLEDLSIAKVDKLETFIHRGIRVSSRALLGISLVLIVTVSGDMYYTVRYFHTVYETIVGVAIGMLLFILPCAMWVHIGKEWNSSRKPPSQSKNI
eukprot:CAMPEP_0196594182 /NCGR_PEP_ID=MMETSP1081-20130531/77609_1 /TAXON_ID=36882 /ORGANISM="Pyramimonas amylifera, Strain CCMP720" /LENGTH=219 /DNA_ID=CAMNT_0041918379 /DNA_START=237 /DNA_END=896 /DNA_ORIENTATION=-